MNLSLFNFANATWLWALALIPLVWSIALMKKSLDPKRAGLERFADKHLLPYLTDSSVAKKNVTTKRTAFWSVLWTLGVLALAGPRWDYKTVDSYKPNKSMVVLLDLAKSMDATDLRPSRLTRARQKIQDILDESRDVSIGLVAFADDAHLITPITDDKSALHNLLPALQTDLSPATASRLSPALYTAGHLLEAIPGKDKSILVMSDGNFDDSGVDAATKALQSQGIHVNVMAFGTIEGAPIPLGDGQFLSNNGEVVLSRLNSGNLHAILQHGNGLYLSPSDSINGRHSVVENFHNATGALEPSTGLVMDWEPRFYIFLIPLLLFMLPLFRKRRSKIKTISPASMVAALAAFLAVLSQARADQPLLSTKSSGFNISKIFKNRDMLGKEALDSNDYKTALQHFQDPYRRGVVEYKAGQFAEAEKSFRSNQKRSLAVDSQYNLGNAEAQEGKYEEAIHTYEDVLKVQPKNQSAQINLKIVKKLLEKKEQQAQHQRQNKSAQGQSQKNQQAQSGDGQGKSKSQPTNQVQNDNSSQGKSESQRQASNSAQENNQGPASGYERAKDVDQKGAQASEKSPNHSPHEAGNAQKQDEQAMNKNLSKDDVQAQTHQEGLSYTQKTAKKNQLDVDADLWLNRITSDPHEFLKNQFLIESARAQNNRGEQP